MQAERRPQQVAAALGHGVGEAHVLADARRRHGWAVAVGHFVAQHSAHPGPLHRVSDLVERTVDGGRAGVVVDERRRAVLDGVYQANQGAILHVNIEQRPVEPPPQPLQDVGEVLRRRAGDGHAAGKRAIEVGVGTDVARHDQLAAGVQPFGIGIAQAERRRRAEVVDAAVAQQ